jgi:uncharacterized protein (DUF885 family)
MRNALILICFIGTLAACSADHHAEPAATIDAIASEFLDSYFGQFPEEVYEVGYPNAPNDRFGDHSTDAISAWDKQVDDWITALNAVDMTRLAGSPQSVTYAFTQERLKALVNMRVCRMHLWNVSPTWTGWQYMVISTLAVQPVETEAERSDALKRATDIQRFVQTEIGNLRAGQAEGYVAPASNVSAVVQQISSLIDTPIDESPFMSPAQRASDEDFAAAYREVYTSAILPSLVAYRDFLSEDYSGRDALGVSSNPDGKKCYAASTEYWSSIAMDPMDIHRKGLSEMSRIRAEMLKIAKDSFGTDDLGALFEELRTNPQFTFESEDAVLGYINAAVERGRLAVSDWFGNVPDAELVVRASPAYEKDSGGGFYSSGTADGSRPGIYQVGTYNPRGISRAGQEATAFHESWPGHHMQGSIALLDDDLHPILRYMFISGSGEGWALYTERLADEMGLYSDDVARLGMLSNEAYRAARLVVDPGIHVLGWSREQSIEYMMANTAEGYDAVTSEVDRYAAVPGQATSYLLGSLEIQRLRHNAEQLLGARFDIREFHDRILMHGSVTLPMLGTEIDRWIGEVTARDKE